MAVSVNTAPAAGGASVNNGSPSLADLQGSTTALQNSSPYNPATPANTPQTGAVLGASTVVPSAGSTGLAGTTFNAPGYIAGIQQEYGAQLGAAPTTIGEYNQAENTGIQGATGAAQAQSGQQQAQANSQLGTLGTEANTTQAQQNLSLSELAAQIRGQNQGLQAQLGAVGAGSSSAVGAGQYGLAQEQNTNRANIQQQTAGNEANITSQEQGVNTVLASNLAAIDQAKNTQIANVQNQYAQLMTQLNTAVETAQGEEKARLAEFGQNLTDSAVQSLTSINQQAQGAASSLVQQSQAGTPNLTAVPTAQSVAPIQVDTVSPFSTGANSAAGNATASSGGSLDALLNQQQQNSQ